MTTLLQLKLGAEAGDPRAQLSLAYNLLCGIPTPQAAAEAAYWTNEACKKNNPDALLFNAVLATIGLGRPRDVQAAYEFVARAAAAGSVSAKAQLNVLNGPNGFDAGAWTSSVELKQHFQRPRIYTAENFIPKKACAWLCRQVRKRLAPATVVAKGSEYVENAHRTNSSANFRPLEPDLVAQLVNLRIAQATDIAINFQESSSMLRYERGQEYKPHFDFFVDSVQEEEIRQQGQRVATALISLNDDYQGGETDFPRLDWRFKGQTGELLFFWSVDEGGQLIREALHAGLNVTKGEKWMLSKWLRTKPQRLF